MQFLVGVVDAELLEAVGRKRLEAKDVEHAHSAAYRSANVRRSALMSAISAGRAARRIRGSDRRTRRRRCGARRLQACVDAAHDETEEPLVERLGERIARLSRLARRSRSAHRLPSQLQLADGERCGERGGRDAKSAGDGLECRVRGGVHHSSGLASGRIGGGRVERSGQSLGGRGEGDIAEEQAGRERARDATQIAS